MEGLKYDAGKPRLDLIPPEAILAIGEVMTYGAAKYAPNSWRGVEPERYVAALLRHLMAYQLGEHDDPESSLSHMWHVATNAAFLVALEERSRMNGKHGQINRPDWRHDRRQGLQKPICWRRA